MSVVGIDFGNAASVLATVHKGKLDIVANEVSKRTTATMAAFKEKERYLGEAASSQWMMNWRNTVTQVKRLIGRRWSDESLQAELAVLPYKIVAMNDADDNVGIQMTYQGEQRTFLPEQIVAMILQKFRLTIQDSTQTRMNDLVLGCPAYFTDRQRRAMINACSVAGLTCLRLMNETTAVALSWGFYKLELPESIDEAQHVMFVDMGNSSLNVSVVDFAKNHLRVRAHASDGSLGGRDFDRVLADHFAVEFKQKYSGVDVSENKKARLRLEVGCEKVKKVLTTNPLAPINVECLMNDIDVRGQIKREDFDAMCAPLLERVEATVRRALEQSGLSVDDLTAVELVGGGTRVLSVEHAVGRAVNGKTLMKTLNREEACARGLALQCAALHPSLRMREYKIEDVNAVPINIACKAVEGAPDGSVKQFDEVVFRRNCVFPKTMRLPVRARAGFEITAKYGDMSTLPKGTDEVIGRFVVPTVPDKPPTDGNELPLVNINVGLDIHGLVNIKRVYWVETYTEEVVEEPAPKKQKTVEENGKKDGETESEPMNTTADHDPLADGEKSGEKVDTSSDDAADGKPKVVQRQRHQNLLCTSLTGALSSSENIETLIKAEKDMHAADLVAHATSEAKNTLESYVYDTRSKLGDRYEKYADDATRSSFRATLDEMEDWLYDEGEDTTIEVYQQKLRELRNVGDPIEERYNEDMNRADAFRRFETTLKLYSDLANSTDDAYSHIEADERQKVLNKIAEVAGEITQLKTRQDGMAKHEAPVLTCALLEERTKAVTTLAQQVMNKPKPAPAPEPKADEQKADGETPTEGDEKKTGDNAEQAGTTPTADESPAAMDDTPDPQ